MHRLVLYVFYVHIRTLRNVLTSTYLYILYVYTYMNTYTASYRFVNSGGEDFHLSRRSRARVVRQMQSESEAGLEPRLRVLSKGHSDVKTKKGSHPAKAYIVPLPKEARAGPTACPQFIAEPDFCTGTNVVIPFPSAKEERYHTL